MKVLAFLQNPWFPEGTKEEHIEKYRTDDKFRRRVLAMSETGKRLLKAFGEETYDEIVWDNVAPAHTSHSRGITPADPDHIQAAITSNNPDLVLVFGIHAAKALKGLWYGETKACPHPMKTGMRISTLVDFAMEVKTWVNIHSI